MSILTASERGAELGERVFAARSAPRGPTLFAPVSAEKTGMVVQNNYDDPRMWGERFQEFSLGSIGTGVAIGDYDNDDRPDVVVVSKIEGFRLFRNLGQWKFEDVTERAGLTAGAAGWTDKVKGWLGLGGDTDTSDAVWHQAAAFADVNNDGWLDLYITRFAAPNLLFINQGDGTFSEEASARGLAVVDASVTAAFCDYDRDGWLDLYLQTNVLSSSARSSGQPDYLFHNNGDGTFADVTRRAGIQGETQGHSAVWLDYDQDGWPDLYATSDFAVADKLYRNHRDGTFTNVVGQVVPHTPYWSMGSDLGDVNNDGLIDFLAADMATRSHVKDQRSMATARKVSSENPANAGEPHQYSRSALYVNTGTGRFLEAAYLAGVAATDWTWTVRWEDLDNDGRLDLYLTNGMVREFHNADLRERVMRTESLPERIRLVRASPPLTETHRAFRNLGDLQFTDVAAEWGLDETGISFGAAFGDMDGDGDLDLIHVNYQAGVSVLRNDSDTGGRVVVALRGKQSNRFGVGATVRIKSASGEQVRTLVLARGYASTSEPILHFGLGRDPRIERLTVAWPSGAEQTFSNLAPDRHYTITEPEGPVRTETPRAAPSPTLFSEIGSEAGLAQSAAEDSSDPVTTPPFLPFRQNGRGPGLAVGDLDGDGDDDVVVGGTSREPARVLWRQTAGPFTLAEPAVLGAATALADGPVLIFDVNQDGRNDVLISKSGVQLPAGAVGYQPRLYWGAEGGTFRAAEPETLPTLPVSVGAMAAADFDRDGRLDVFLGGRVVPGQYPLSPRSALWRNEGGRFTDVTEQWAPGLREPGMVTSALWSDVDGDGWQDLLVALEWGTVRCYHNEDGKTFTDWTERAGFAAAGTGWWSSLAAADFNGDRRPDYVAGNVGLNTRYQASADHPALLFLGDFAGKATSQIIEAYYEGDRLFPWRTRKDLGTQIPAILKRYPTDEAYGQATVEEILGTERLARSRRFAATQFQSGIFLSQADGRYRFAPLPRIAQIAPFQGVAAGDFDGDGHADIYAAQNSFAPLSLVGRFDGGLSQLLRGDGQGHFEPVPPRESGLLVPRDAKALVVSDLNSDGWPDFVVSRNNDAMLAFRNNGVPGRRMLRVTLRGGAGNAAAIGARVMLQRADGSTQTAEVHGGSGYLSQSLAGCFFGYSDANRPQRLSVRWPSGVQTDHEVPREATSVTLTLP